MSKIAIPKSHADLPIRPPVSGSIPLSDTIQHVLALLVGSTQESTTMLQVSPSGAVCTTSKRLQDIVHYTANVDNYVKQGDNKPTTEIMVMGHPNNTGKVWARSDKAATVNNAWPLAKNAVVNFSIDNLSQLHLLIEVTDDTAIVAYTR